MALDSRVVIRVALLMPDDSILQRDWTWGEIDSGERHPFHDQAKGPPWWLDDPRKEWENPQDPITFTGTVLDGHEDDALGLLASTEQETTDV